VSLASNSEPLSTSADVLAAFAARSWRSNAMRQIEKGVEFVIGRREGIYLWNLEGTKRVIDCGTAGGVHSLGHRHPEVLAALTGALEGGRDTGLWSMPNAEYLKLQDRLAQLAPHPGLNRSVITLSSTASIDVATMFAFRFTQRRKILAYRHGYHGHSGFAVLATGSTKEGVIDYYNLPQEHSAFFENYEDLSEIERRLTPEIGALIVEPMNYETFEAATKDYFNGLSALCKQRGVLFIVDETRTGLGRTGRLWASENYDIEPAMMISGKGLSGGLYPVSALLVRQDIYDKCMNEHSYAYISSLGGNEISCIVARKVLEVASRPSFLKNVRDTSDILRRELDAVCRKYHNLLSPSFCYGGIFTVRINDESLAGRIYKAAYKQGVLCHSTSVIEPTVLKFLPPLTLDAEGAREIAGALDRALQELHV
jgi:acetylornithine aminotransferase